MPLFERNGASLSLTEQTNFGLEKDLQTLIEKSLETVFSSRFVATEFSTGVQHAGRIDTLGLSEDGNPVIIEYKKTESSDLINQSLYYLHWLADHRGDFEVAARERLGQKIEVDWSDIRVICLAPAYKKYDLHAVQVTQANIELWRYRLFSNGMLYIEEVFAPVKNASAGASVPSGKKASITAKTTTYSVDDHLKGKANSINHWFQLIREFVMNLDDGVDETPKKRYLAYKAAKNFVSLDVQNKKILVFLKLEHSDFDGSDGIKYRDVTNIGHYGTGNAEITVESNEDVEILKPWIERSFHRVGGA